ncbi:MAG: alpha-amylase family glycosyl hydrolase [Acidobacteriaceae bacterium]
MISQANCTSTTPMGANLISDLGVAGGGATFRVWAPRAIAVYLTGVFGGVSRSGQTLDLLLQNTGGYWSGFLAEARDGDTYGFFVLGPGSKGYKRDPYARELANDPALPFPACQAVLRAAKAYPWHDSGFRAPEYSDMILYQLHIGTYAPAAPGWAGTYLDVIEKIPHLVALGINVVQPLPVYEMEDSPSQGYPGLGYQGSDLYSPAIDYAAYDAEAIDRGLATINRLLAAKGHAPIVRADLAPAYAQMKAMVDLLHVYGIAVTFDVVYNHAGGWGQTYTVPNAVDPTGKLYGDDYSLYFWDRALVSPNGAYDNNQSLYFSDRGFVGGLSFALWNMDVRGFLKNNAAWHLHELHADGFRYDEISVLLDINRTSGWDFCRELTELVRSINPGALQNAEYWPGEYGAPAPLMVRPVSADGLGFDAVQHDSFREAVRSAISQAGQGASAHVGISAIASALWPAGFHNSWQAIPCIENHDIVKLGEKPRIPTLADSSNTRSWYARSRTRVATALLLTAPGIPQLFMGQEFLEDKQWCPDPRHPDHLIWWSGLAASADGRHALDPAMADHLRFTQDLVALRRRLPALRGEGLNVFFASDTDRVLAFHRWIPGSGQDVVIIARLSESTVWNYRIGFPHTGRWTEAFNSDAYDSCNINRVFTNPQITGNGGAIIADGPPLHTLPTSVPLALPANSVLVFTRG